MKRFTILLAFSFFIFILGICHAKTIGMGASPMKLTVSLGNETDATNNISYSFVIYNTGETIIRVVPVYIDGQLLNFSRPLLDELVLEPNTNDKFPILFFRNGTEKKELNMTLRFVGESDEEIPQRMIALRPATDIKINLIQKAINVNNPIYGSIITIALGCFIIILIVAVMIYTTRRIQKQ